MFMVYYLNVNLFIIDITENVINCTKLIVCSWAMYVLYSFAHTLARTHKLKKNWGARTRGNHAVDVFLSLEDYDVSN